MTPLPATRVGTRAVPAILACIAFAACSGSSGGTATVAAQPARVLVTTATSTVEPSNEPMPAVDLAALGVRRIDAFYSVSTPPEAPFALDLASWSEGRAQARWLTVHHVRAGDRVPAADGRSLAAENVLTFGPGLWSNGSRTGVYGDGVARLQLRGMIREPQLLAVTTDASEGSSAVLVRIAIGAASAINRVPSSEPDATGVLARETIYSSPSWQFGLPAVAVSGLRPTVVCYDGQRRAGPSSARYELRLQQDRTTGAVTGGATLLSTPDPGNWREHDVIARANVLAVARCETDGLRLCVSYDRGVTFVQDEQVLTGVVRPRLVQMAIGRDYVLAITAWRARADGGEELVLVEAQPSALDPHLVPTWYRPGVPQVIHAPSREVVPLAADIAWSDGGDLVVGYATTALEPRTPSGWTPVTTFRCAVRLWGGTLVDREVDRETVAGTGASVAVSGFGAAMRVLYAHESAAGLELVASEDAGATFGPPQTFGRAGDHMPTAFVRPALGQPRIDVLYLAARDRGTELHQATWLDGPAGAHTEAALTRAALRIETITYHPPLAIPPSWTVSRLLATQVAGLGYDAALDGNGIVVAFDEVTQDAAHVASLSIVPGEVVIGGPVTGNFLPAVPPPLAPGITEPLPPVDAGDAHLLKLLRLQ